MTEHPLVSILVPLYNKAPYVEETIRSALSQTYPSIEVIVIDDGSTDGSADVVAAIEDPRLQLIRRENRGANATRNELLGLAQGEFIQYLDADDLIDATKTERQMAVFTDEVDAVACRVRRHGRPGDLMPRLDEDDLVGFLAHHGLITVAPLYRAEHLRRIGGWRVDLAASQEYELHLRLALRGAWRTVRLVDEPLASYRTVRGSTSGDDGRLYTEKARALRELVELASDAQGTAIARALANASRHLARSGSRDLARENLSVALLASRESLDAFPARLRWVRHPTPLVAMEALDHFIRTRRRPRRSNMMAADAHRVLWLVPDFPAHDDDPSYVFLLNEARSLAAVPEVELLVASFAEHPHHVSGVRVVNLAPPRPLRAKAAMLVRTGLTEPNLLLRTMCSRSSGYPLAWRNDAVAAKVKQFCPDVVHSHFAVPEGTASARIAHRHGVRSIVSLRGVDLNTNPEHGYGFRLDPMYDSRFREMLRRVDLVLVATSEMRARAIAAGALPERTRVLPNATNARRCKHGAPDPRPVVGLAEGATIALSVGNLIGLKGFHHGVAALGELQRNGDFHYVILGDGPERARLLELAAGLGVAGRLHLLGAQPPATVQQWMEHADVFWFLSETEAFGNVVLEAFATSMRIVAAPTGIAPELLVGDQGCLILDVVDSASIARATRRLLEAPTPRETLAAERRARLSEFDPDERTRRLLTHYLSEPPLRAGSGAKG
jgi:glycosyltransferase involved in cell wall biosynthesis